MSYSIIGADEREYGPVSIQTLVEWAKDGRVVPRTSILEHATGRRFLACDLPELAAIFDRSTAIAPPVQGRPYYPAAPPMAYPPAIYVAPRRNRFVAGALGIFFGVFGAHRFYLGHTTVGAIMLAITVLTCGLGALITSVWGLVEGVLCLAGAMRDADGQPLLS